MVLGDEQTESNEPTFKKLNGTRYFLTEGGSYVSEEGEEMPEETISEGGGEEPQEGQKPAADDSGDAAGEGVQDVDDPGAEAKDTEESNEIIDLFESHMNEQGNLPGYLDHTMANKMGHDEAAAREEFYNLTGQSKSEDYVPYSAKLSEIVSPEKMGIWDQIKEGMKRNINNAIKGINDLTESDIEQLNVVKGAEDLYLVDLLSSHGLIQTAAIGSIGAGAVAGIALGGWVGVGVTSLGIGVANIFHSFAAAYDDPERIDERYDTLFEVVLPWDGILDAQDAKTDSKALLMGKIYVAEIIDDIMLGALFGGAGKVGKAAIKRSLRPAIKKSYDRTLRALGESGQLKIFDKTAHKKGDIDDLLSKTAGEMDDAVRASEIDMNDYLKDLKSMHYNEEVLDALKARRNY